MRGSPIDNDRPELSSESLRVGPAGAQPRVRASQLTKKSRGSKLSQRLSAPWCCWMLLTTTSAAFRSVRFAMARASPVPGEPPLCARRCPFRGICALEGLDRNFHDWGDDKCSPRPQGEWRDRDQGPTCRSRQEPRSRPRAWCSTFRVLWESEEALCLRQTKPLVVLDVHVETPKDRFHESDETPAAAVAVERSQSLQVSSCL